MARRDDSLVRNLDEELEANVSRSGSLLDLLKLVAEHSLWTPPRVVRLVGGAVFPSTRRKRGRGENRGDLVGELTVWENQPARTAIWTALEQPVDGREWPKYLKRAWVCHIYGDEDSVHKPEHFSNLANLVVLPAALQSITEWKPVRDVLKFRSYTAYGYTGPSGLIPQRPPLYPEAWPGIDEDYPLTKAEQVANRLLEFRSRDPKYLGMPSPEP